MACASGGDAEKQRARVTKIAGLACEMLGVDNPLKEGDIQVHDDWYGPSYGKMNETTHEALALAGQMEGLIVDPTYTAKSFAGLIGMVRAGAFPKDGTVGWIHTGGTPGLFAYMEPVHAATRARRRGGGRVIVVVFEVEPRPGHHQSIWISRPNFGRIWRRSTASSRWSGSRAL